MIYLGFIAAVLTSVSFVPQVYKIWKTNDTQSISLTMFLLFTSGVMCWLVYGYFRNDIAITIANGFTLTLSMYILYKKVTNDFFRKF
jgi:MtN3 and saliva related transmembrane protein